MLSFAKLFDLVISVLHRADPEPKRDKIKFINKIILLIFRIKLNFHLKKVSRPIDSIELAEQNFLLSLEVNLTAYTFIQGVANHKTNRVAI